MSKVKGSRFGTSLKRTFSALSARETVILGLRYASPQALNDAQLRYSNLYSWSGKAGIHESLELRYASPQVMFQRRLARGMRASIEYKEWTQASVRSKRTFGGVIRVENRIPGAALRFAPGLK